MLIAKTKPNRAPRWFARVAGAGMLLVALAGCGAFNDPGYILYTVGEEGSRDIAGAAPSGDDRRVLIGHPSDDFNPVWSPDKRHIAFLSDRDGNIEVYVARADGSGAMRVTNSAVPESQIAWAPDGTRLAYVSPDHRGIDRIYWVQLSDLVSHRLEFTSVGETHPAWSPSGEWVAFAALDTDGNSLGIRLRNPAGVNQIRISDGPDWSPAWSPDSRRVAYVSAGADGLREIYVVSMGGDGPTGEPRLVAGDDGGDYFAPVWSPDGRRIAFLGRQEGGVGIYTVSDRGADLRAVTRNSVDEVALAWGRDGRIVFESQPTGRSELFIVDRDGVQRQISGTGVIASQPHW